MVWEQDEWELSPLGPLCPVIFTLKVRGCLPWLLLKDRCRLSFQVNEHWLPGLTCVLVSRGSAAAWKLPGALGWTLTAW